MSSRSNSSRISKVVVISKVRAQALTEITGALCFVEVQHVVDPLQSKCRENVTRHVIF